MPSNNPQELINNHLPLVAAWVAELEQTPEDVKSIGFMMYPTRDLAREKAENSHWKIYKPADEITIRLVFADDMIETRSFDMNEWNNQFTAEA